ncbi:hypothetical protein [Lyngbya sp. PCC 8106]|uniref:hypothetical protein n=1 Tax=Lyngbya sp. (strain PCC 8106) TaxID=313612 RepID=UPI0000EA9732|nr:hypothetical protein [Lyngbya sp. PCC 8106]EAW34233.1 nifD element site-specific recombinase [Lyngbya sp. PCC 8106]
MSNKAEASNSGSYKGYEAVLKNAKDVKDTVDEVKATMPKGISFKIQDNKYLMLQFKYPGTGKRLPKSCNVPFAPEGVYQARDKAWKVKEALSKFKTTSEFWGWYDQEILEVNEIVNDLKTYREIFQEIEDEYFNGVHKNTGEKRSRDNPSFTKSYKVTYLIYFNKFPNWDKCPNWKDFNAVLSNWNKGTKSFRNAYFVLKKIATYSSKSTAMMLLEKLSEIDPKQTEFTEKQYILWDDFTKWRESAKRATKEGSCYEQTKKRWLWVTGMIAMYGLRPTEIAASLNLDKPYTKDGVTIPAINDPNNELKLLVTGSHTPWGATTKTGFRISLPFTTDKGIWNVLELTNVFCFDEDKDRYLSEDAITSGFNRSHRQWMTSNNSPVTQMYAFRRLNSWLKHKYGIPETVVAASLGHSVDVNRKHYMSWSDFRSTVDMLTGFTKEPLGYKTATEQLTALGIDVNDPSAKLILRVIYQLE